MAISQNAKNAEMHMLDKSMQKENLTQNTEQEKINSPVRADFVTLEVMNADVKNGLRVYIK